jgi:magnesium-transporting ATPase (P-type)
MTVRTQPTVAQRISQYSKFVVAFLGAVVALVVSLVSAFGDVIPAEQLTWINTAIAGATAIGVWIAKNETLITNVADIVDGDPNTPAR